MLNPTPRRAASGILLFLPVLLFLVGCGPQNTLGRLPVKGTVTLDGAPLESGSIQFESQASDTPLNSGSVIEAGKYEIPAEAGLLPGKFKVLISSSGGTGETIADPQMAMDAASAAPEANRVPAKYNVKTELEADVKADTENVFDFDLKST
ncbi:hypothetical protein EC9_14660 [Rosistilla ulvae]|uniref:Carboxypeptidase regulatory-like domain-containing protein n=1 Tax=Rosistilla ulvae TaxID=1930277 RepID=A0A517LXD7_9BACT|nr:hypothetical protein [Rosistilla ulvae]QDS87288.1 hypothetical protein EC9_14660 [Rosistilla ulvae]